MSRRCSQHSYLPGVDHRVLLPPNTINSLPFAGQLITGRSLRPPISPSNHRVLTVGYLLLVGFLFGCVSCGSVFFVRTWVRDQPCAIGACGSQVLVVDRQGKHTFHFLFGVLAYVCLFISLFHVFRFLWFTCDCVIKGWRGYRLGSRCGGVRHDQEEAWTMVVLPEPSMIASPKARSHSPSSFASPCYRLHPYRSATGNTS